MKKFIAAAVLMMVVFAGVAYADRVKTIDDVKLTEIRIQVYWDTDLNNIVEVIATAKGVALFTDNARAGKVVKSYKYNDLPTNPKNGVKYLIETSGRALNVAGADNNVAPTVPDTMPGQ